MFPVKQQQFGVFLQGPESGQVQLVEHHPQITTRASRPQTGLPLRSVPLRKGITPTDPCFRAHLQGPVSDLNPVLVEGRWGHTQTTLLIQTNWKEAENQNICFFVCPDLSQDLKASRKRLFRGVGTNIWRIAPHLSLSLSLSWVCLQTKLLVYFHCSSLAR